MTKIIGGFVKIWMPKVKAHWSSQPAWDLRSWVGSVSVCLMLVSLRYTGPVVTGQRDRVLVGEFLVGGISGGKCSQVYICSVAIGNFLILISQGVALPYFSTARFTTQYPLVVMPCPFIFPSSFKGSQKKISKKCLHLSEWVRCIHMTTVLTSHILMTRIQPSQKLEALQPIKWLVKCVSRMTSTRLLASSRLTWCGPQIFFGDLMGCRVSIWCASWSIWSVAGSLLKESCFITGGIFPQEPK